MRLILDDAVPGPDSPGLEVHDELERFLDSEARAGGVLYVGLRGGEAGTVLTEPGALSLIWELLSWSTHKRGAGAVLAAVPENVLRAELARRHARLLREGLGDPAKLVAERAEDLRRGGRQVTVDELCKDCSRFGLTPQEVRKQVLALRDRGAWSLPDGPLLELEVQAADRDADLRADQGDPGVPASAGAMERISRALGKALEVRAVAHETRAGSSALRPPSS